MEGEVTRRYSRRETAEAKVVRAIGTGDYPLATKAIDKLCAVMLPHFFRLAVRGPGIPMIDLLFNGNAGLAAAEEFIRERGGPEVAPVGVWNPDAIAESHRIKYIVKKIEDSRLPAPGGTPDPGIFFQLRVFSNV